mmetsp:Transcript_4799/g.9354  ORF Transcript_4799/g.9354 Transcript_4799/m.9354 type:complete len:228 (+) Transcript_4799:274-957(+)
MCTLFPLHGLGRHESRRSTVNARLLQGLCASRVPDGTVHGFVGQELVVPALQASRVVEGNFLVLGVVDGLLALGSQESSPPRKGGDGESKMTGFVHHHEVFATGGALHDNLERRRGELESLRNLSRIDLAFGLMHQYCTLATTVAVQHISVVGHRELVVRGISEPPFDCPGETEVEHDSVVLIDTKRLSLGSFLLVFVNARTHPFANKIRVMLVEFEVLRKGIRGFL